jgi:hypothetical protein
MNPYLTRKREQAKAIKDTIDGLQTRAAEENRDLTEEELRSIDEQSTTYKAMVAEIESLTDVETRSRKVSELAASLEDGGAEERTTSNAEAKDRDPGHYRSAEKGGTRSFFGDLYRAKMGDREADRFLVEHNQAMRAQSDRSSVTGDSRSGAVSWFPGGSGAAARRVTYNVDDYTYHARV